ncbi:MAG: LysM peptidoglycan-binding domain-containing protein [Puniceicoccales bacterium]|jgi:LysM repeat protein|nr:LysM peptidoglycan-binding domain-containing protein [Puniceicoccales bacterium]
MKCRIRAIAFLFFFIFILANVSCGKVGDGGSCRRRKDGEFFAGRMHMQRGHPAQALQCFSRVSQRSTAYGANAHFECGEIYLNHYNDPISAIYHYRKYLELQPNERESALVRQRIGTAEKAFLSRIPALRHYGGESHGELLHSLKLLQNENLRLRRQIATLKQKCKILSTENHINMSSIEEYDDIDGRNSKKVDVASRFQSFYTVLQGDTLSSISEKIYGNSRHWKEIFDANVNSLPSPARLKIGQQLGIPSISRDENIDIEPP